MKAIKNIYEVFAKMNSTKDQSTETVENPGIENEMSDEVTEQPVVDGSVTSADEEGDSSKGQDQDHSKLDTEEGEEQQQDEVDDSAEVSPEEYIAQLEEQLAEAQAKASEHLDRLQRTVADFQNTKRRQEKQLSESIARASSRLVERILPVLDDFDLAFKNLPEEMKDDDYAWVSGFQQIQKKLLQLIEDEGVTMIPEEGEFDPNRHEAVSSEPSDEIESGHIIETLRAGYEHNERVLRPALVRVAQ